MRAVHLTGIKTKAQCGVTGLMLKTSGRVDEVTCDLCKDSARYKRMKPPENKGGIMTTTSM